MQPSNVNLFSSGGEQNIRRTAQQPQDAAAAATRSLSGIRRLRSDESWIEVSSRPSSSSLSSVAADDGVTPGLRIQQTINSRRRRRLHRSVDVRTPEGQRIRARSTTGSSQEEYEESESESDRIMSSSNEELQPRFMEEESPPAAPSSASENAPSDEDDDGVSTAIGTTTAEPVFTPQPNAFSHPPVSQASRQAQSAKVAGSYFPAQGTTTRSTPPRHTYPSQRVRSHHPYNMISPSYQADHDAALRASLSTLLSCAAAARGLPKHDQSTRTHAVGPSNLVEPSTLRMVPESEILSKSPEVAPPPLPRRPSVASSSGPSVLVKGKRKSSSRDRHDTKKKRRSASEEILISPTLMTWMVSAGVVVLFSAISFSAGFAYGKEMGRLECSGVQCGRETGRGYGGLRRLRWGNGSVVRV